MTEARELIENLRTDCVHYLGDRPCWPHVEAGHRCTCVHFQLTKRRGVIVKLGAAGDVLRSTPLLRALDPAKTGTKILWVTHSPDLLPTDACEAVHPTAATLARIARHLPQWRIIADNLSKAGWSLGCVLTSCRLGRDSYPN